MTAIAGNLAEQTGSHPGVSDELARVAEAFTYVWANPNINRFMELLHPDVRLTQPLSAPIYGKPAARREFEAMFRLYPDLCGEVDHWSADGDFLMIAWRLRATIGRNLHEWRIADHIRVKDGLIIERDALYDSVSLMGKIFRAGPRAWIKSAKLLGYLPSR